MGQDTLCCKDSATSSTSGAGWLHEGATDLQWRQCHCSKSALLLDYLGHHQNMHVPQCKRGCGA